MFHSMLSSSLNIGLINPRDILDQLKLLKNDIPLNSLEGYFRQLCWREFQRYCYIHYSYLSTRNYFSLKKPINKKNGMKEQQIYYRSIIVLKKLLILVIYIILRD